jgi:hypothetical protein
MKPKDFKVGLYNEEQELLDTIKSYKKQRSYNYFIGNTQ